MGQRGSRARRALGARGALGSAAAVAVAVVVEVEVGGLALAEASQLQQLLQKHLIPHHLLQPLVALLLHQLLVPVLLLLLLPLPPRPTLPPLWLLLLQWLQRPRCRHREPHYHSARCRLSARAPQLPQLQLPPPLLPATLQL